MRLLVFTPTYTMPDGSLAMSSECKESVLAQVFDGQLDYVIGQDNPYPIGHRNVLYQYQQAQAKFLAGDWDALLTVEHDNVLPDSDAVRRLVDTPGDVVYAPYLLRHGTAVLSVWQYIGNNNLGESLTLHPGELEQARASVVWRVCGVGHGCTLFRRHALETIRFRAGDGDQYAPDIPFARDALKEGFVSNGRFDVPVLHKQGSEWLHPYKGLEKQRYYCLVTANAMTQDGTRYRLVRDTVVEIPPGQAFDLVRAGFVQPLVVEQSEAETATAEPEMERAVIEQPKRRKAVKK